MGGVDTGEQGLVIPAEPAALQRLLQRIGQRALGKRDHRLLDERDYFYLAGTLHAVARGNVPNLEACLEWPVEQMLSSADLSLRPETPPLAATAEHCGVLGNACVFEAGYRRLLTIGRWEIGDLGVRAYRRAADLMERLLEIDEFRRSVGEQQSTLQDDAERFARCAERFEVYTVLLGHLRDELGNETARGEAVAVPVRNFPVPVPQPTREEGIHAMFGLAAAKPPNEEEQYRGLTTVMRIALLRAMDIDYFRSSLERRLIGQPEAIDTLVDHFTMWRSGTSDPTKPLGLLCIGPTGVGKTYTAEVLQAIFSGISGKGCPIKIINGPEFTYPSDVNELKGAARGFIRSDEEGIMADFHKEARDKPFSVFVVDELTKGHPQLRRFFMSLLDKGVATDNRGKDLYFAGTVFVMTTNLGYSAEEGNVHPHIGFGNEAERQAYDTAEALRKIRRELGAEFMNRLHMVRFRSLTLGDAEKIFDLELAKIAARYAGLGMEIYCAPEARQYLLVDCGGYSAADGARRLKKVLDHELNAPLARIIDQNVSIAPETAVAICAEAARMMEGKAATDFTYLGNLLQPGDKKARITAYRGVRGLEFSVKER